MHHMKISAWKSCIQIWGDSLWASLTFSPLNLMHLVLFECLPMSFIQTFVDLGQRWICQIHERTVKWWFLRTSVQFIVEDIWVKCAAPLAISSLILWQSDVACFLINWIQHCVIGNFTIVVAWHWVLVHLAPNLCFFLCFCASWWVPLSVCSMPILNHVWKSSRSSVFDCLCDVHWLKCYSRRRNQLSLIWVSCWRSICD